VDLKAPIRLTIEFSDDEISATALINLASGEIERVEYEDTDAGPLPWDRPDYEFTCGTLSNNGKDVEFTVQLNRTTGQFSVNATELLEIKVRAAQLFAGMSPREVAVRTTQPKPPAGRKPPLH